MGVKPAVDDKKAIEVILYVASRNSDMFTVFKLLYFADKGHLAKYGRFVYGDRYIAMTDGPVPSRAYEFVKFMQGKGPSSMPVDVNKAFKVQGNDIIPLRPADMEFLSESEVECLDEAMQQYGGLRLSELWERSKDRAWWNTPQNKPIPMEEIAGTLPDTEILLDYLLSA